MDVLDLDILDQGMRWILADCDLSVAAGLRKLVRKLMPSDSPTSPCKLTFPCCLTSPYSLTSRRYSAWGLIAETVDDPLDKCLERYRGLIHHPKCLRGFRLSRVGRQPPMYTVPSADGGDVPAIGNHPRTCPMGLPVVDWQLENVELWRANLRAVIDELPRGAREPEYLALPESLAREWLDTVPAEGESSSVSKIHYGFGTSQPLARDCLSATLKSVWYFLGFLNVLRPQTGKKNDNKFRNYHGKHWKSPRLLDKTTRHREASYCELCWRPTIRSQHLGSQVDPYCMEGGAADRFCSTHSPSDPTSSYQTDRHYRRLFEHELRVIKGRGRSAYGIRFDCPAGATEDVVRKTVYDLIHAFPMRRSFTPFDQLSLAERVYVLRQHGQRNIDIARELGVSKQAVSKAWQKLIDLGAARANEKEVYLDTHEAFTTDGRSSRLFADVRRLRDQGATTAQIAKQLHYFKHTIKAVCRWLDAPATPP